jgi:branched-chain amino acid transport system permease protein
MRAAAEDFTVSRLLGIRADVVIGVAFAISGALAGVGAYLLVAQTGTWSATMGLVPVIFGFTATVLGGLGSLSGAVIGGYIVGTLATTLQVALPDSAVSFRDAILFVILFAVLAFRPQGLVQLKSQLTRVG